MAEELQGISRDLMDYLALFKISVPSREGAVEEKTFRHQCKGDVVAEEWGMRLYHSLTEAHGSNRVEYVSLINLTKEEERFRRTARRNLPYSGPFDIKGRIPGEHPEQGC